MDETITTKNVILLRLESSLIAVADLRRLVQDLEMQLKNAQDILDKIPEFAVVENLKRKLTGTKTVLLEDETTARQTAVSIYRDYQDEAPLPGVVIKHFKVARYDPVTAEAWACTNAPTLFVFDTKAFEKVGPKLPGAPILVEDEPRAQLARDLSEYTTEED
jgi:hypothetical protein